MKGQSQRALLGLVVIFVGLAALVFLTTPETPQPVAIPEPAPDATPTTLVSSLIRVFPELRVLDIQAIQLEDVASGTEITFIRDGEGHWAAPELEGDLDGSAVSGIARTFALFPYGRSLNIVPETEFEDYGLAPAPELLFQVLRVDGESHAIAIGDLIETGEAYFALVDERDEIFQLERGPVDYLRNFIFSPPIRLTN